MAYLNDVSDGGETELPVFGFKVKPERGKTRIRPVEWINAHVGAVVKNANHSLITG